jgi:hypothetical protein
MKLFVTNTTKQNHVFAYRLQERQQVFVRTIRAGGQICLDNLDKDEIDRIVAQHVTYGMIPAKELSRKKGFTGLVYNVDSEINVDAMLETFENNDKALDGQAQVRREVTAQAIADGIGKEVGKVTKSTGAPPSRLEIEITEDTTDMPTLASGVEVISNPDKVKSRRTKG